MSFVKGSEQQEHCPYCDHPIPHAKSAEVREALQKENAALLAERAKVLKLHSELQDMQRKLEGKRIGRPTKAPVAGERIQIGVQVAPNVKTRLEASAERSHRSLSREAEFRLDRSFDREDLLSEALALAYGRKVAGILLAIAYVMDAASRLAERNIWNPFRKDWTDDPERFDHAVQAATALLYAVRPPGEIPDRSSERSSDRRDPGTWLISELLLALRDDNSEFPAEVATEVKQLLGPLAERMTENAAAAVGNQSGSPKLRLPVSDTGEWALKKARITRRRLRK